MDKRVRVGLIFSYNENWIAGSYYILNLIHSLKMLEDLLKPHLVILSSSENDFDKVSQINYPFIDYEFIDRAKTKITYPFVYRLINKFLKIGGINKKLFKKPELNIAHFNLDILFPAVNEPFFHSVKKKIFWIPDFQEHFLPYFFSSKEVLSRKVQQQKLVNQKELIVFSSYNALSHFKQIYPDAKNTTKVLQFAVSHPDYSKLNTQKILKKYNILEPYYFCSNQFWAHKNHIVVLEAIKKLKEQGRKILVVFSGKHSDYRNPEIFNNIIAFVDKHKLGTQVNFLGFIDRKDQLLLMKNSIAIIQPSLFEGWSTVVEDAKAMSQYLILSSLDVHKEQIQQNATFFDPKNSNELATILSEIGNNLPIKMQYNYNKNQKKFAEDFVNIIRTIKN
jgi:glycosyltransferase involved in cell wall biosynthesis